MDCVVALLQEARRAGLVIQAYGDRIEVRGPRRAEVLVWELIKRKWEILELFREPAEGPRLDQEEDPQVPVFTAEEAHVAYEHAIHEIAAIWDDLKSRGVQPSQMDRNEEEALDHVIEECFRHRDFNGAVREIHAWCAAWQKVLLSAMADQEAGPHLQELHAEELFEKVYDPTVPEAVKEACRQEILRRADALDGPPPNPEVREMFRRSRR